MHARGSEQNAGAAILHTVRSAATTQADLDHYLLPHSASCTLCFVDFRGGRRDPVRLPQDVFDGDRRGVPDLDDLTGDVDAYARLHAEALLSADFDRRARSCWGMVARGSEALGWVGDQLASDDPDRISDAAAYSDGPVHRRTGSHGCTHSPTPRLTEKRPPRSQPSSSDSQDQSQLSRCQPAIGYC